MREANRTTQKANLQRLFLLAALLVWFPLGLAAQVNSNQASVGLNAVMPETISVSTGAVATVNFNLTSGSSSNPGSATIPIATSWVLQPSRGTLAVYAYFDVAASALTHSTDPTVVIPSANVEGSANAGPLTPFTQNTPYGVGHGLPIGAPTAILGFNRVGTRNDTLDLNINLSGFPLPAGTYTGTLRIQAQAI